MIILNETQLERLPSKQLEEILKEAVSQNQDYAIQQEKEPFDEDDCVSFHDSDWLPYDEYINLIKKILATRQEAKANKQAWRKANG